VKWSDSEKRSCLHSKPKKNIWRGSGKLLSLSVCDACSENLENERLERAREAEAAEADRCAPINRFALQPNTSRDRRELELAANEKMAAEKEKQLEQSKLSNQRAKVGNCF
jgi:hypothetical protein